ncbi:hypothetical protein ARMGADRAFT_1068158 [Armillaria gallica]|uniref:Uncharacterized protein n=1 Tax=Armillaria gallica TaxID=47427 RepID=A0A2H3CKP4_ARMGA|nr:hypothetical protein ARMGADRAFT_1068158 [Armillaria gallica]
METTLRDLQRRLPPTGTGLQRKLSSLQAASTPAPSTYRSPSLPPPAPPAVVQAKALWAYNLDVSDPDDFSFSKRPTLIGGSGSITAAWLSSPRTKYVQTSASSRTLPPAYVPPTGGRSVSPTPAEKREYKHFMAAHSNVNAPPPPGAGTNSVGLQQDPGQDGNKSTFGKYGNTMTHSAAGGVGLGASAAIGGDLVRAIF